MKRSPVFILLITFTAVLLSSCSALDQQAAPTSEPIPTVEASSSVISQETWSHDLLTWPSQGGYVSRSAEAR
jgi:hypothetical protein